MKKVFSVLMILGLVIGMAACGNKKAEEEARIQDSIRVADSLAAVQAEMDSIAAAEAEAAAALEQARLDSIAAAEAAVPAKKTTVQKAKEVVKEVKEAPATKSIRGGGTSGTK
jgi:di/tripeptidase